MTREHLIGWGSWQAGINYSLFHPGTPLGLVMTRATNGAGFRGGRVA